MDMDMDMDMVAQMPLMNSVGQSEDSLGRPQQCQPMEQMRGFEQQQQEQQQQQEEEQPSFLDEQCPVFDLPDDKLLPVTQSGSALTEGESFLIKGGMESLDDPPENLLAEMGAMPPPTSEGSDPPLPLH
eukprot:TRINITY_DN6404_c0_g1_i2.p1 TRINITY_DN6404_c0_g1~~TRINITY_DN6404_c0_g1_i2.p1  ORF type:complete len:129 (-),score=46.31 TRINITY_DN6404_c0_g1_i2:52-438(-)